MFRSAVGIIGFLIGVSLTIGLLLTPHMLPWTWLYGTGRQWHPALILGALAGALLILLLTLWVAGRLIRGAHSWRQARVISGALLIAFVVNALFSCLVEFFALGSGWRALGAVLGVPVIYGNLVAVLGRMRLKEAMIGIFSSALATVGVGFIVVALIRT